MDNQPEVHSTCVSMETLMFFTCTSTETL